MVKKDVDNKRQQKENNSWFGGLTKKFWKPSNADVKKHL